MFRAVHDRKDGPNASAPEPCLGTLTNHFSMAIDRERGGAAGEAAGRAVREAWSGLAGAVWDAFFNSADATKLASSTQIDLGQARSIWAAQIGSADHSPLWEISWVVAPEGEAHWLDARRNTRWFGGSPDLPTRGNFCSMMTGWAEISGFAKHRERDRQDQFWSFVRDRAIRVRYGADADLDEKECLDIRPGEVLCAPALVKRLFPLLSEAELIKKIGWVPYVRADDELIAIREEAKRDRSRLQGLYRWFVGRIVGERPRPEPAPHVAIQSAHRPAAVAQYIMLWPSTSAMAAAHWIARVNKCVPGKANDIVGTISTLGQHYRHAGDQSLWLG